MIDFWRWNMDFISVQDAAKNWGISERRIQKLCEENRIEGAVKFSRLWLIPRNAQKPSDRRRKELPKIENIIESYGQYVYNLALKLSANPEYADDLTQETFIKAWLHIKELRSPEAIKKWLRIICINEFRMSLRKQQRENNVEALKLSRSYSPDEYIQIASELYCSEYFQIQEIGVLLYGYASSMRPTALKFLSETVSTHPSWKVQEVLAMAFDIYCSTNGYKNSLPTIKEWLQDSRPNVRRAVSEGLRIWTNRDYFRENPQIAISLLSNLKADNSEYVRKSAGNALRDISKKFPTLIKEEISTWDVSDKKVAQVYKLAYRYIAEKSVDR